MSLATTNEPRLTTDALLELPADGVERWLIRGQLRTNPDTDRTRRNRFHSTTAGEINGRLWAWLQTQPVPRGRVVNGDAGFILARSPDITVGADVAVIPAALATASPTDTTLFDGAPILAVEILSPNDVHQDVTEKVMAYLDAGSVVWLVDPDLRTVTVHRFQKPPAIFGMGQILTGGPELPGFSTPVHELFL